MPTTHLDISNEPAESTLPRKVLAEFVGTFFLTLVSAGVEIVSVLEPGHIDRTVKAAAPALVVAAMIYSVGDVSGAHLNPAVTLAFGVRRSFPMRYVPAYVVAQVTGAIAAAMCLRGLFGTVRDVGVSRLDVLSPSKGFILEAVLTVLLVFVVLNAAHNHYLIGTQAALAVAATIAACGMIGGELTTASLNPARSLGPAIASGKTADLWVFVAGPTTGALVALALTVGLRPHRSADEREAAQGSPTN
ncbi:MAG: aquaporin [Ilumatobacteraceae bacterium]